MVYTQGRLISNPIFFILNKDYDNFVTSILTRTNPYTIEEIEALLFNQEERLEKYNIIDFTVINNTII